MASDKGLKGLFYKKDLSLFLKAWNMIEPLIRRQKTDL